MPTIRSTVYTALAIFAAAPAAATIFLTWKRRDLAKRVTVHTSVDTTAPSEDEVRSIPQKLRDSPSEWVLSIERASKAVSKSQLPDAGADELLVQYLRTNMVSFTYTPQAPLLRAMCKAAEAKRTFEKDYLEGLGFEVGNLVCGVFRVVVRERGRVEMALDPHESFTGPRTEGRLVAAVEERGGDVVFFNGKHPLNEPLKTSPRD
jgi:hypothetical protein